MPRPSQDRDKLSFYAKRAAIAEVESAAAVEGVDRSEMLRRILGLGLGYWKAQQEQQQRVKAEAKK